MRKILKRLTIDQRCHDLLLHNGWEALTPAEQRRTWETGQARYNYFCL